VVPLPFLGAAAPRPCLLGPDATAGYLARDDPDEQVVFPGGPWPQVATFAELLQLGRLQYPVRAAADQHAPPLTELQVKVVGLEGDPPSPCAPITEPEPVRIRTVPSVTT
jgi:hypothetical protein